MAEPADSVVEDWRTPMRYVIIRAISDALGYTNIPVHKKAHGEAVREAQAWFLEVDEDGHFEAVCDIAGVDAARVRAAAKNLIQAKWSGDYTRVPEFWRHVFAEDRMPNLTNIERALDAMKKGA
jgi:hypothetical protein